METPAIKRAINRYAAAVAEHAFEGGIPYTSCDPEEQEQLDAIHARIRSELKRSRELMIATIQRAVKS